MSGKQYKAGCNAEGYKDPTASAAIEKITREEQDADRRAGLLSLSSFNRFFISP